MANPLLEPRHLLDGRSSACAIGDLTNRSPGPCEFTIEYDRVPRTAERKRWPPGEVRHFQIRLARMLTQPGASAFAVRAPMSLLGSLTNRQGMDPVEGVPATLAAGSKTEWTTTSGCSTRAMVPSVMKCTTSAPARAGQDVASPPAGLIRSSPVSMRARSVVGPSTTPSDVVASASSLPETAEANRRASATARPLVSQCACAPDRH